MTMPSYNRRLQNSNNLVFLTPATPADANKNKNQYRQRINSLPNWNKQPYSSSNANIKGDFIPTKSGLSYARKRRSESSTSNNKDVILVVDDEPGNKRKKSVSPEKNSQNSVSPYCDLVSFIHQ